MGVQLKSVTTDSNTQKKKKSKLGDWHCAMGDKTFTSEAGILYGSQTLVPISPLPM